MRRPAFLLAALLAASPAHAADQWNAGTLTGTGRTETLTTCYTHASTKASCIARRATSVTNVATIYATTGAGDLAATTLSPTAPSTSNTGKVMLVGGDATTLLIGGGGGTGRWLDSSPLSSISWTREKDSADSGYGFAGIATPTSPDKTYQHAQFGGTDATLFNVSIGPWSFGNLASNTPTPGDQEVVSTSVSATYYCIIAGEYSSGQPYMRGYTSGTSYAFTTQSPGVVMNTGSYFYPPFGLSATACVATVKRQSNSQTYILSAPIGGTITRVNAGMIDLIPLGDWDPTGSLRRGWWINKADGTVRVSNSATTVASIATNATYDIGSTPLGGSTPLFAITGLDMDGNGATANPVVLMADGTHFAWWGTPPSTGGGYRAPKRKATGPFNSYPFSIPGALP